MSETIVSNANNGSIDLLVVDDDAEFRATVVRRFRRRGFRVQEAASGEEALGLSVSHEFDVAVVDMMMPVMNGLELIEKFRVNQPDCETIMLTGQGTIESAVEAMKLGAFDYLRKPFPLAELELIIQKAYERHQLQKENRQLKEVIRRERVEVEMIGKSTPMQEIFRLIERCGPTDKAILIQGESGTGKELVARALHRVSPRVDHPLVVINCAAMPEPLLESELFGHEKGAFTGAVSAKPGLFEVADGGTLMIDEIGDMPFAIQAKLLRVLEDGSLRRVGSLKERRVNVRLLAATNADMAQKVQEGKFREDLFYRINVMSLKLPPLRQRTGDIPLLIERFLGPEWSIEPEALASMKRCPWPGNVRQMINALERAKILADDQLIHLQDLPEEVTSPATNGATMTGPPEALASIERAHIIEVLKQENGNKARAARILGVNRRSLYRLLEKFSISPAETGLAVN